MRIARAQDFHCGAGWRDFSFLKLETEDGLTGWAEYNECYGSAGLSATLRALFPALIGEDPRATERLAAKLQGITRQAPSGIAAQARAAIENAALDLKAKAFGVPAYELLGGKTRERLALYWSHCGSYRLEHAQAIAKPPLRDLAGCEALGREVAAAGFGALKTNIFRFAERGPHMHMPGFAASLGWPERNADAGLIADLRAQIEALRRGAGEHVGILLDLNFNFRAEANLRVARALDDSGLFWFEIDSYEPRALAEIRRAVNTPIASLESLYGRGEYRPFLEARAVDVAIVDVPWNGAWEAIKIAALADAHEINVAPHNFYGWLSTLMSAHFCAAIPNFRIMEIDVDDVPWRDEIVSHVPEMRDGALIVPDRPGWGAEIDEAALAAHPPTRPH